MTPRHDAQRLDRVDYRSRSLEPRRFVLSDRLLLAGVSMLVLTLSFASENEAVSCLSLAVLGLAIMQFERQRVTLWPAAPLTLFWVGHFLCYAGGGTLRVLHGIETVPRWQPFWSTVLVLCNYALALCALGYCIFAPATRNRVERSASQNVADLLNWRNLAWFVGTMTILLTIPLLVPDGLAYNLSAGLRRHTSLLPPVMLGLAILSDRKPWWVVPSLAAVCLLGVAPSMIRGGREAVLVTVAVVSLFWIKKARARDGLSWVRILPITVGVFLFAAVFAHVAQLYRGSVPGLYRGAADVSASKRAELALDSLESLGKNSSEAWLTGTTKTLALRLYEAEGTRLIGIAKRRYRTPSADPLFQSFVFQYIPVTYFPKKAKGRGLELMRKEGILKLRGQNSPPTLLGDSFYRFGDLGVGVLYGVFGALVGLFSGWVVKKPHVIFIQILSLSASISLLRMYSLDTYSLLTFFTYSIPIQFFVLFLLFKLVGRVRPGIPQRDRSVFLDSHASIVSTRL